MKEMSSEDRRMECRASEVSATPVVEEKVSRDHAPKNGADGDLQIMEHFVRAFLKGVEE